MGIGDNIGSALLKEYANGYKKGEQDGGEDAIRKFAEWLQEMSVDNSISLNYGKFSNRDIDEVIAEYEKQMKEGEQK